MNRSRLFYQPLILILASRMNETAEYGLFVELFFRNNLGVATTPTLNFSSAGVAGLGGLVGDTWGCDGGLEGH